MKNKEKAESSEEPIQKQASPTKNKKHRKTNHDHPKSNAKGKGLDLSLFEGHVPADTICTFCRRVLVQPQVSSCQHVFCASCLRSHNGVDCPLCGERLQGTSQQAPTHLRLKLLNLTIHCDNKCGQVMLLGQLPQHIKEECPNTPVPCLFAKSGCRMKVKRCEREDHLKECELRPVQCEACGEKTTYKDLFTHQKKNQCVQNRIKNQLLQAVRVTRTEERNHKKNLDKQRVHMELHVRKTEIEHARRLTTARLERQVQQNYQFQRSQSHMSTSPSRKETQRAMTFSNDFGPSVQRPVPQQMTSREDIERYNSHPHGDSPPTDGDSSKDNDNVFVTHMAESEDGNATTGASEMSRDNTRILTCRNCSKPFKLKRNKATSCRWHAGPIVDVFGGTCYSCGRLDYQMGCATGFHEA